MKILHTSDWHLGQTLYDFDCHEEHLSMLQQMAELVSRHKPDLFLLAGDVFHVSQPSSYVSRMFADALVNIHDAHPEMTIVVTAGNHDSATRHNIFQTPWKRMNVHVMGSIDKDDPASHIIEVEGKGFVVAIPYTHERNMPEGFVQQVLDRVNIINSSGLPVILTAHTTVAGSDFTGHDTMPNFLSEGVGGIDAITIDSLGSGFDYLALGHIHKPQTLKGTHAVARYSGTPMAVNFDETYPHTVSLVEIDHHGSEVKITEIEIKNPRPLVSLPSKDFTDWERALKLYEDFPADMDAYIRLNIEVEGILPSLVMQEAKRLAQSKKSRFCLINLRRGKRNIQAQGSLSMKEFKEQNPLEIMKRYTEFLDMKFDAELEEMFRETLLSINDEENI